MKTLVILVGVLVLTASFAFADSIDEAEAKKQGTTVEAVQIARLTKEKADLQAKSEAAAKLAEQKIAALQTENAALKKQVDELTTKIEQMKAVLTPEAKAKLTQQETFAAAIKVGKILDGMTIEQANQALNNYPGKHLRIDKFTKPATQDSDGEIYHGSVETAFTQPGSSHGMLTSGYVAGTGYTIWVKDGIVLRWESKDFSTFIKP